MNTNRGMTEILKTITSFILGAIVVFGVYIILFGHVTSGGGFAGGLIIAFLFILYFMAYGKEATLSKLNIKSDRVADSIRVLGFLFIISLLLFTVKEFMHDALSGLEERGYGFISRGIIPLENIMIGLKVGASMFLLFVFLSVFRREK